MIKIRNKQKQKTNKGEKMVKKTVLFIALMLTLVFVSGVSLAETMRVTIENGKIVKFEGKEKAEKVKTEIVDIKISPPEDLELPNNKQKEIIDSLVVGNEKSFATELPSKLVKLFPAIDIEPAQNYKITYDKIGKALVFQEIPFVKDGSILKKEKGLKIIILSLSVFILLFFAIGFSVRHKTKSLLTCLLIGTIGTFVITGANSGIFEIEATNLMLGPSVIKGLFIAMGMLAIGASVMAIGILVGKNAAIEVTTILFSGLATLSTTMVTCLVVGLSHYGWHMYVLNFGIIIGFSSLAALITTKKKVEKKITVSA